MSQIEVLAPWRSPLARALHRNRSLVYARYAQLATIDAAGYPRNRTIVFRGFVDQAIPTQHNALKFITDQRSEKIEQITANPQAELCWYFPKTREQFRILGQMTIVSATGVIHPAYPESHHAAAAADSGSETSDSTWQKLRRTTWHDLSDNARGSFAWPTPKTPRSTPDAFEQPTLDPQQPHAQFCLLLLQPAQVDHLELKGDPQNRCLYTQENGAWKQRSVNP